MGWMEEWKDEERGFLLQEIETDWMEGWKDGRLGRHFTS